MNYIYIYAYFNCFIYSSLEDHIPPNIFYHRREFPPGKMEPRKLHLVLCCIPCYGHVKPLMVLAEDLVEAGHEVSLCNLFLHHECPKS